MIQQTTLGLDRELSRLEAEYKRRDSNNDLTDRYSLFDRSALLRYQSFERNILMLLKKHNFTKLAEKKILDVGCGSGSSLLRFLAYGALPSNLFGIDLMARRIEQAQRLHSSINWQVGSAHQLPYQNASFDLVMSSVVFSSILSEPLRQKIADEMWRVRKPGGLMLFHDFIYSNPRNPAVRGVTLKQVQRLFGRPGAKFDFRRITLAPPISRVVSPRLYWLACTLEQFKILNTHIIGIISLKD
jgi:ubiquinone/menaquinone biosynthesis C-methylase UbiE